MMNTLLVKAIKKADEIRTKMGFDMSEPVNVFDCCIKLGVNVRFIDINMEGMYISNDDRQKSNILLSTQRPLPRRVYTCAHELGHHLFEHGTKIDTLTEEQVATSVYDYDEYLVDAFAGALLMPVLGIQAEFIKRGWALQSSSPIQFYTISSVFGVGYGTLITHCRLNGLINNEKANSLAKHTPGKILKTILGIEPAIKSHFKIIDEYISLSVIDLEVTNYIILPKATTVQGRHLEKYADSDFGTIYIAKQSGIIRVASHDCSASFFVRIQSLNYVGLVENRHLEN